MQRFILNNFLIYPGLGTGTKLNTLSLRLLPGLEPGTFPVKGDRVDLLGAALWSAQAKTNMSKDISTACFLLFLASVSFVSSL